LLEGWMQARPPLLTIRRQPKEVREHDRDVTEDQVRTSLADFSAFWG
jgi:hypothetical protein